MGSPRWQLLDLLCGRIPDARAAFLRAFCSDFSTPGLLLA